MAALLCSSSAFVKAHDHRKVEKKYKRSNERQKEIIRALHETIACLRMHASFKA